MYIEFRWNNEFSSNVIDFMRQAVLNSVDLWAERFGVRYRTKVVKNVLRITFDDDSYYTLFVTSWRPPPVGQLHEWWFDYRIVEPMNTRH
jgi:hypothetical protein